MKTRENKKQRMVEETILANYNQYYRMAMSYVHQEQDAYDIVQNAACKAISKADSLREVAYVSTWVYRIVMNEIYSTLGCPKESEWDETNEEGQEDAYEDFDLQKALDALPFRDKGIIQMRYFEDMSLQQIAEIVEEPISTVKSRLYRGLKKLRLELED